MMVEAELLEISSMAWGNSIALVGLIITLISGYLIAAYIVGANMTHSQSVIINILYLGFASFLVLSYFAFSQRASELEAIAYEMSTQRSLGPREELAYAVGIFMGFCVLASLKFMWDIRHPQPE
jgi:hypothetical protein